jgi:2-keto-4-pentenoate hydratase
MDDAIARGMEQMLEARARDYADGAQRLGWKVGFNSPQAMALIGVDAPIVGYLTDATLVADGGVVAVGGYSGSPLLESEVAVRIGDDGTIAGQAAALEVVDLGDPGVGVERILAGNIFHRAVILGEFQDSAPADEIAAMARHVAAVLARAGEELRAGDVIITGAFSVEPVAAGDVRTVDFGLLGELSVEFGA